MVCVTTNWRCEYPVHFILGVLCLVYRLSYATGKVETLHGADCIGRYYTWPTCQDNPDGYGCLCGPGFYWNTRLCISTSVNSRFELNGDHNDRHTLKNGYAKLVGKTFPDLIHLTITMWVRVPNSTTDGTLLSYSTRNYSNLIQITAGRTVKFSLHGETRDTGLMLQHGFWVHLAFTWSAIDGSWFVYENGAKISLPYMDTVGKRKPILRGGDMILGQSYLGQNGHVQYDSPFIGDLSHVNIWKQVLSEDEIRKVYSDCTFTHCGTAVQWTEFRFGTHGNIHLRWPSEIVDQTCFTDVWAAETCDDHCSYVIGAQCNEEIVENIRWSRTPAGHNVSVPCPGRVDDSGNATAFAYRYCNITNDNKGVWGEPQIDECLSQKQLSLKTEIAELLGLPSFDEDRMFHLGNALLNHTTYTSYTNPIDIAAEIDSLNLLIKAQGINLRDVVWKSDMLHSFARTLELYPSFEKTIEFTKLICGIVNDLVATKNDAGWRGVQPPGAEGEVLIASVEKFTSLVAKTLIYHVKHKHIGSEEATVSALYENIAVKVRVFLRDRFMGFAFPDHTDTFALEMSDDIGTLALTKEAITELNETIPNLFAIASVRFSNMARLLPNHNITIKSKRDNVNSVVYSLNVYFENDRNLSSTNLSSPVKLYLPYTDDFNISNPDCVMLRHREGTRQWRWSSGRGDCFVIRNDSSYATCGCYRLGTYAVTTDMFNVDWDRGEHPPHLMTTPSYVGCAMSTVLCLGSAVMLIYLRTSSPSAAIHKNFGFSISLCQLIFMVGVTQTSNKTVCHVFAVLFHYFFLTTFSWMMNEAFNLYIKITYAAHSHGPVSESGSIWRYYILGWVVPGALVGALVGSHGDSYYAADMCWIRWDLVWFFIGPVIAIQAEMPAIRNVLKSLWPKRLRRKMCCSWGKRDVAFS
ncbi:adhesion G protein-coupled receptor L2 [Lingula anatina]|uniref:Adhesion G protein-coupled receptor L2 n=1 Tax=Lingula anatina TaxID=7574 RepID=A0A2R2MN25_LINAN|nr:adhesion G protein-coupled receptor L2 [Lingula anatina]|eukprot:XP_023931599.1 adhesion G protein-coupled receptor L2 [Lingula anatina]